MKKILILAIICCICLTLSLAACGQTPQNTEATDQGEATASDQSALPRGTNPIVQFKFRTGETITVELYPDQAPISVANFLTYVEEGYYVGTVIHRVESYVVQGGGYVIKNNSYTYKGNTHDAIKGEFASNGVANSVPHVAGAISMARTGDPDSATSQFFFCPIDMRSQWDGNYAAFGKVTDDESLAVIQSLTQVPTTSTYPNYAIIIDSVTRLR